MVGVGWVGYGLEKLRVADHAEDAGGFAWLG